MKKTVLKLTDFSEDHSSSDFIYGFMVWLYTPVIVEYVYYWKKRCHNCCQNMSKNQHLNNFMIKLLEKL